MKFDFTLRIWQDEVRNPVLSYISLVSVSGLPLVSKGQKFGGLCFHNSMKKKMGYQVTFSKSFIHGSGSHSTPVLAFKGEYIDISVKNFPRFPAFPQCPFMARNIMKGYGCNELNNGFPKQLLYRKIEFFNIQAK